MRIPVRNTIVRPSYELTIHLQKLQEIAAIAKCLKIDNLYTQAREAYDTLVSRYNSQLPETKKSFWKEFVDNITFNMDTTVTERLKYMDEDGGVESWIKIYSKCSHEDLVKRLSELNR